MIPSYSPGGGCVLSYPPPQNPSGGSIQIRLQVRDPLVELAYAGPPRPDDSQEIPLRLDHRPCSGVLATETAFPCDPGEPGA